MKAKRKQIFNIRGYKEFSSLFPKEERVCFLLLDVQIKKFNQPQKFKMRHVSKRIQNRIPRVLLFFKYDTKRYHTTRRFEIDGRCEGGG